MLDHSGQNHSATSRIAHPNTQIQAEIAADPNPSIASMAGLKPISFSFSSHACCLPGRIAPRQQMPVSLYS
jgi:hypothetical protein